MKSHTYYDILGVSRDATLEEITTAKNALAKIYHPDANVHKDIDTTALMQEILEAYRVLSDPEKRKEYNRDTFGETTRVFRTFKVGPEDGEEENEGEKPVGTHVAIVSDGGKVNIRVGNGTQYGRVTQLAPGTTLDYVATASNGWHAVVVNALVGWVSGEYSKVI